MTDFTDLFAADMAACIRHEFAVPIVFIDRDSGTELPAVRGIFDRSFMVVDPDTHVEQMSEESRATVMQSDLPAGLTEGDELVAAGVRYAIYSIEDFGLGALTLRLHESA